VVSVGVSIIYGGEPPAFSVQKLAQLSASVLVIAAVD